MSLQGVGEMITQDIIKRQEELGGQLRPDDLKTIAKIPATTWQPWFEEGQVVFSSTAQLYPLSVSSASRQSSALRQVEQEQAQLQEEAMDKFMPQMDQRIKKLEAENCELQQEMCNVKAENGSYLMTIWKKILNCGRWRSKGKSIWLIQRRKKRGAEQRWSSFGCNMRKNLGEPRHALTRCVWRPCSRLDPPLQRQKYQRREGFHLLRKGCHRMSLRLNP